MQKINPKFRVWDPKEKKMFLPFTLHDGLNECAAKNHVLGQNPDHYVYLQYLDIQDKNGKELCNGDIVEHHYHKDRFLIFYNNLQARFEAQYQDNVRDRILKVDNDYFEVIGNIYETPELFKR